MVLLSIYYLLFSQVHKYLGISNTSWNFKRHLFPELAGLQAERTERNARWSADQTLHSDESKNLFEEEQASCSCEMSLIGISSDFCTIAFSASIQWASCATRYQPQMNKEQNRCETHATSAALILLSTTKQLPQVKAAAANKEQKWSTIQHEEYLEYTNPT